MSTPDPVQQDIKQAAIPELISMLQSLDQFFATAFQNPDPAQIALNAQAAKLVLLGQVGLQLNKLGMAELAIVPTLANGQIASWVSALQAQQAKA